MFVEVSIIIVAALVGLAAAALVNAFLMRSPEGLALTVRRTCAVCAHPVAVADLMPIVGYVRMKGQCRRCRAVIPWHYVLAEIFTACWFALLAVRVMYGVYIPSFVTPDEYLLLFCRDAFVGLALVFIFVFDAKASVIPDQLSIPALIIAILFNVMLGMDALMIAFGLFLLGSFFAFQTIASRGRWVGGGDVRVGMLMGALLGPAVGVFALLLSYMLGALVGLYLLFFRRANLADHVPFGTFMVVAIFTALLFGEQAVAWYLGWFV